MNHVNLSHALHEGGNISSIFVDEKTKLIECLVILKNPID